MPALSKENHKHIHLSKYAQIPNVLTCLRILLALIFPFASQNIRPAILAGAILSDFLDGAIARRYFWKTEMGQILDPIADKFFFATIACTLLAEHRLHFFQLIALGIRDITVFFGTVRLILNKQWTGFLKLNPMGFGKITTALQYTTLLVIILNQPFVPILVYMTFFFGTLAAIQYTVSYF